MATANTRGGRGGQNSPRGDGVKCPGGHSTLG